MVRLFTFAEAAFDALSELLLYASTRSVSLSCNTSQLLSYTIDATMPTQPMSIELMSIEPMPARLDSIHHG